MVVKRDLAEIYAPLRRTILYLSMVGLVGILFGLGMIYVLSTNLSRPIRSLSHAARRVEGGDLNARAHVTSTNTEEGLLTVVFNSMIERIQNWGDELEKRVGDRTAELEKEIQERKQVELTLREERDKAQKYLDIAGVMFVVINADQEVVQINKKGCEILGYGQEEIIGRNWFDTFLPQGIIANTKEVFNKLISGEAEFAAYYENPVVTRGGEERLIAWHNTILNDDMGRAMGTSQFG